ncbi:MAG: hypothetical protein WD598_08085 [Acidimicrobiia bacterium]
MRKRTIWIAVLAVAMLEAASSIAFAADETVAPRTWARRMCVAALPGAERGIERFATAGDLSSASPSTVEEMVARVEASDELVAGIADVLGGFRDGVVAAGVPRIPDGRATMAALRNDLDRLLEGLDAMRAAFARFLEDPASDPAAAAAEVQAAFEEYLNPDAFGAIDEHWPQRLTRAMRRVPECVVLSDAMDAAAASF